MMFPYSKGLIPQSWNTLNGISPRCSAKEELNFLEDSDSKRFLSEPDAVKYNKDSKPLHDLVLGTKP
jgi:hypothetical protein